ncbi:hypothetical protein, partial [uncultured Thiocystis sp.]|uniref:hypothetical protein n=1 Tax=uncultured Thiocystis sp. TaxID=1202134 RepID=UPI0025F01BD3
QPRLRPLSSVRTVEFSVLCGKPPAIAGMIDVNAPVQPCTGSARLALADRHPPAPPVFASHGRACIPSSQIQSCTQRAP